MNPRTKQDFDYTLAWQGFVNGKENADLTVLLEGDIIASQRMVYPNDGEDGEHFLDRVMDTAGAMVRKAGEGQKPYVVIMVHCQLPACIARDVLRWQIQHGETLDDRLDATFQMVDMLYPGLRGMVQ